MEWLKSKLIPDIRDFWKRWSVWVQAAVVAWSAYFLTLPEKVQDAYPHSLLVAIGLAGAIATLGLLPIKQSGLTK